MEELIGASKKRVVYVLAGMGMILLIHWLLSENLDPHTALFSICQSGSSGLCLLGRLGGITL